MMASFDPDHALAILLQSKFNEEAKKKSGKDKEKLQLQIKPTSLKTSLISPEWEMCDPCPDIHGLFVAFNEQFFWGRLLGVEVKWSSQMTSCAGICVYEGRNGLCSVRLSNPLLKLRPRSDLVETLLHEMIHAYLFVTHNNRDRDGHGPEFHKHMYRINKEAGTNITVYHSFHAEVKVYQQHWWRCNGPCKNRAPFFGMVKRAKNRAPGPNDIWWNDHKFTCGGEFIKVRQPEGYVCKKNGKDTKRKEKNIRDYFKKPSSQTKLESLPGSSPNNPSSNGFHNKKVTSSLFGESPPNRIVSFSDLSAASGSSPVIAIKPAAAYGVGSDIKKSPNGVSSLPGRIMGKGGMVLNQGSGTLVTTGSQEKNKRAEKSLNQKPKNTDINFKAFSGTGFSLGGSSTALDKSRSRLLYIGQEPAQKRQKTSEQTMNNFTKKEEPEVCLDKESNRYCKCLVCHETLLREEMDLHLESCVGLLNVFNDTPTEDVVDEKEIIDINQKYKVSSCPVCAMHVEGDLNNHLDECLNTSGLLNLFNEPSVIEIVDDNSSIQICSNNVPKPKREDHDVQIIESEARVACPICGMRFGKSRINDHVNHCLDSDMMLN